jgi:hypothetical protein
VQLRERFQHEQHEIGEQRQGALHHYFISLSAGYFRVQTVLRVPYLDIVGAMLAELAYRQPSRLQVVLGCWDGKGDKRLKNE